jgi:hypothetical protein
MHQPVNYTTVATTMVDHGTGLLVLWLLRDGKTLWGEIFQAAQNLVQGSEGFAENQASKRSETNTALRKEVER